MVKLLTIQHITRTSDLLQTLSEQYQRANVHCMKIEVIPGFQNCSCASIPFCNAAWLDQSKGRICEQVIRPEDSGTGFSEVGALSDAKEALREVVQLPLQYPELFASASLARLSKGVLLFGPPGIIYL